MILPNHLIFYQWSHNSSVVCIQSTHYGERLETDGEPHQWIGLDDSQIVTRLLVNSFELPLFESRNGRFKSVFSFYRTDCLLEDEHARNLLLP